MAQAFCTSTSSGIELGTSRGPCTAVWRCVVLLCLLVDAHTCAASLEGGTHSAALLRTSLHAMWMATVLLSEWMCRRFLPTLHGIS